MLRKHYSQAALDMTQAIGDAPVRGYALTHLGHALAGLERWPEAESAYADALELRRSLGDHDRALEPLAGIAYVALTQGDGDRATALVEEILHFLESGSLERLLFPIWVHWVCYRVLSAAQDPRSAAVRQTLLQQLQQHNTRITPPSAQSSPPVPIYQDMASFLEQESQ